MKNLSLSLPMLFLFVFTVVATEPSRIYQLEAKRKLLKSMTKECRQLADSLKGSLLEYVLEEENEDITQNHNLLDPRRIKTEYKSGAITKYGSKRQIIASLDSLDHLIKQFSDEEKALNDTILFYLKGTP